MAAACLASLLALLLGGCVFDLSIPQRPPDAAARRDAAARDLARVERAALPEQRTGETAPDRGADRSRPPDRSSDGPRVTVQWFAAFGVAFLACPTALNAIGGGAVCGGSAALVASEVATGGFSASCEQQLPPEQIFAACASQQPYQPPCAKTSDLVGGGCDCLGAIRTSAPTSTGDWKCDCDFPLSSQALCIDGASVTFATGVGVAVCPSGQMTIGGGCAGGGGVHSSVPWSSQPVLTYNDAWKCTFASGSGTAYVLCAP